MEDWKKLKHTDLEMLGFQELAYFKSHKVDGKNLIAIYGANGEELAKVNSIAEARILLLQNEMKSVTVH